MSENVLCAVFIYLHKVEIKYMLQEFGTIEAFKGYSNMRQIEDNMFQQNKYSGEYTEVAKSNLNMRQMEDNMFQQNRFLGEYAEGVNGNSNMRQTNMRHTEDNMFQPKRFLGDQYAEVAKGYSNMRHTDDNMFPNRFVGEYVNNNKVGGIFCCCIIYIIQ